MLILDKVEMLNIKHEKFRIQFAENIRMTPCIYIKLYFHYIHCCNISLTNCECLSSKPGISKNSLRVRLQV